MDRETALGHLYGDEERDLSFDGYLEALSALRKRDSRLAKQVKRALDPYLEEVFPSRKHKWYDTSQGTRARLFLLPDNPHLEEDVAQVRDAFGVPRGQVRAEKGHPLRERTVYSDLSDDSLDRAVNGALADLWLGIHRRTALGRDTSNVQDQVLLAPEARHSAEVSARLVMTDGKELPGWLRRPPSGPGPYSGTKVPMDWTAARLVERHRLPWRVLANLQMYILTLDKSWLRDLSLASGLPSPKDEEWQLYPAFSITISGLDEYITKKDWDRIWEIFVVPRQDMRWQLQGKSPQGRQARDLQSLKRGLPLYRKMVTDKLKVGAALSSLDEKEKLGLNNDTDARRLVRELKALLEPVE